METDLESPSDPLSARGVVWLRADAPAKPPAGEPCNGCGLCCLAEPCPLGVWLSRRRRGRCVALEWDEPDSRYRCGALRQPARWLPWLPLRWAQAAVRRWIAAGAGCDAALAAEPAPADGAGPGHPRPGP